MRILVTGGAGFIGSHLVDALVARGFGEVIVLDNLRRGRIANLQRHWDKVPFVQGDIREAEAVLQITRGVDVVYHLAADSTVMGAECDRQYSFSTNVLGTLALLRAAKRNGVQRFVFASSREVYGEARECPTPESSPIHPRNAYGATKAAGEICCEVSGTGKGLETIILRLANTYGSRDLGRVIPRFVHNALLDQPLILFGGGQVLDFVWVGTVVDALLKVGFGALVRGPVNIGSGTGTQITTLAQRIIEITGSQSRLQFAGRREEEVMRFVADISRARSVLDLPQPSDPLARLDDVVQHVASQLGPSFPGSRRLARSTAAPT